MRKKRSYAPALFLAPAMIGILIFKVYPIMKGIYDSFFQFSFISKQEFFSGIENYIEVLTDPVFLNSIKVTFAFNGVVIPLQVVVSFMLALLLMVKVKGQRLFRTLHLIPITVSFTVACVLWGVLLNPEQGLFNSLLNVIGISNQPFLFDKSQALGSVIGIASWKGVGYWALFFIAGLEEISESYYEAAAIDGAGRFQSLLHITLPQMKRTFLFVIVSDTISNFLQFVPPYILTGGGPEGSTDFMMFQIFQNAYTYSNTNLASAMINILLTFMLIIVGVEAFILRNKEE